MIQSDYKFKENIMLFFIVWLVIPFIVGLLTYGIFWAIILAFLGFIISIIQMANNGDRKSKQFQAGIQPTDDFSALIIFYVILCVVIFFHFQYDQKVSQERQNCIQQVQGNSAYGNPAAYCSGLTSSELDQSYPLTAQ